MKLCGEKHPTADCVRGKLRYPRRKTVQERGMGVSNTLEEEIDHSKVEKTHAHGRTYLTMQFLEEHGYGWILKEFLNSRGYKAM